VPARGMLNHVNTMHYLQLKITIALPAAMINGDFFE
jgi:hypothetical protein